jgi:acyl-CoA thioester hydrolase
MPRHDPARRTLASYPIVVPVLARFADMDVAAHVNNVAVAQYFEEGRSAALRELLSRTRYGDPADRVLVARVAIDYVREGNYPGTFEVGVGVLKCGDTSLTLAQGLFQDGECVALCDAVLVHVNERGKTRWAEDKRQDLEKFWMKVPAAPG